MSATTPPAPPASDDDEDDLLDRLRPASMLAHGLKTNVEPAPPAPGPQGTMLAELFHEYRFAGELSHGGFGIVYRAEHRRLKRRAALKLLSHTLTRNAAAVTRFEREIEAVGKLDHPGIVRAFDAGERGGIWFLAMEFIAGMDFARLSKALGPLPPAEVAELGRQAALALQYAHGHGLVHRDVKPSNIMLECPPSAPPSVKVLDFGLAQLSTGDTAGLTISAEFLGTVEYIAPEQVENPRCADLRSDLYGLGATLYRLLTGLAPHEQPASRETLLQKLTSVAQASVTPVRSHRPDIPDGLAAVVDRLLQRDPADRLQSGAEIAAALAPWCAAADLPALAARALAAAPPAEWPAPGRTVRAFRRPGRLRQMLVSASVAAAICIPLTLWLRHHFAPAPPVAPAPAGPSSAPPARAHAKRAAPDGPPAVVQFQAKDFVSKMNVPPGKVCVMHDSDLWFPWWGDQLTGAAWLAWLPPGLPRRTADAT